MKKFSWASVVIGFLAGIGVFVIGMVIMSIIAVGFGATSSSLRHTHGLPFLLRAFIVVMLWVVYFVSGYTASIIARPHGIYNAVILGIIFALFSFLPGSLWGIIKGLISFGLTVVGGMCVKQK